MKRILIIFAITILPLVCSQNLFASHIVINFDEQAQLGLTGVVITNQYSGVAFSSTSGFVNYVTTQSAYNSTKPNFLCSGPIAGSINCTAETILMFDTPIDNMTFDAMGINNTGIVAKIDVFTNGVFSGTQNVIGNSEGYNPVLQNLTAYNDITKIRIYNITDGGGIGWDTFQYDTGTSSVPEPATMLLFGAGLAGLGIMRKRMKG